MNCDKWKLEEDESEYILSEESAAKCVKELLAFYKIKVDKIENKDRKEGFVQGLEDLQEAYRKGILENKRNDDGGIEVIQTVKNGRDKITYRELAGKDKRVMDNFDTKAIYERQQALLGRLSGVGSDIIGNLKRDDLRVAEALAFIFFMG